jgi:hypothetical protein
VCFTLYAASTATVDIHTACPTSLTITATLRFSSQHTLLCTTLHYYRGGARGNGIGGIGSTRKGVQLDIDRIFAGEICVLAGGAKFTADSVLCGVLKVTFRDVLLPTLAEYECCSCSYRVVLLLLQLLPVLILWMIVVARNCCYYMRNH